MSSRRSRTGADVASAPSDYESWLGRLADTHDAVVYTCSVRLRDAAAAAQIGVQVVGGLLARPGVFRYSGLPYSGAIAHLAEVRIAAVRAGRLPSGCGWTELRSRLAAVPAEHRMMLVLACVEGFDDDRIARELECSPAEAAHRRDETTAFFRHLALAATPALDTVETTLDTVETTLDTVETGGR